MIYNWKNTFLQTPGRGDGQNRGRASRPYVARPGDTIVNGPIKRALKLLERVRWREGRGARLTEVRGRMGKGVDEAGRKEGWEGRQFSA